MKNFARTHRRWETRDDQNTPDPNPIEEIRTAVTGFTANAETRFSAFDTAMTEMRARLDRAETIARRPGLGAPNDPQAAAALEQRAYVQFLRGRPLAADEIRSLRVSDDTAGGYLAPDQFLVELLRNVVLFSPVRSVARVMSTSSPAILLPKRTAGMTAAWVGEVQPRPETTVTFGQNRYPVGELAAYVDVSNANLEDSAFDVAAELSFEFAEEFGRAEGAAFVNGNSVLTPSGFMQDSTVAYTPAGDANLVTADGIIDLYHALKTPYRANAVWGMNSATLGTIRKLKTSQGQYLLAVAGLENAPFTTLLGRPVVEMPDMPNIGAGAYPVVFGDFSNGYRIFDRVQLSVLRDPFSQATNGMTRFHGRRRVAGGIGKAEAIRKLKIATS
jgi:HK97 family phage major capsid protein